MSARTVAVFTGSRAEYGLLKPVLSAMESTEGLEIQLIAGGSHLIGTCPTIQEIRSERVVQAEIPMQVGNERTRKSDADAVARGIREMSEVLSSMDPEFLLLLGDRIEVLAAAISASLLGIRVAHIHGGDVAIGVCDDSIRHAVTKLSHIHFPATELSAARIRGMGERADSIFVAGSPAVDGLDQIPVIADHEWRRLGEPRFVILHHPIGDSERIEHDRMTEIISTISKQGSTLLIDPNHDPGSDGIRKAIEQSGLPSLGHIARESFIGLMKRVDVLIGNSSAGLIECAALGTPAVDVGDRQAGREHPRTVVHVERLTGRELEAGLDRALTLIGKGSDDRFGSGAAGVLISRTLSDISLVDCPIRKCWTESSSE